MQPWRIIVVRDLERRVEIRALAQRERLRQADRFDERARQFLDQKVEGIVEAPLGVCVCCDHGDPASRCSAAGRSRRPTSTAPPARSRTCGSRPAPRASASAG
jgi:nitroreductase